MKSDKRKTKEKVIIELRIDSFDFIDNPHNVPAINVAIIIDQAKKTESSNNRMLFLAKSKILSE